MSNLPPKDIKVGAFIWYSGSTSTFSWNCPAVITHVDNRKQLFRVKSLDDCRDQHQEYSFDVTPHSAASRKSMRLASTAEVSAYMKNKLKRLQEVAKVDAEQAKDSKAAYRHYKESMPNILALNAMT